VNFIILCRFCFVLFQIAAGHLLLSTQGKAAQSGLWCYDVEGFYTPLQGAANNRKGPGGKEGPELAGYVLLQRSVPCHWY